MATLKDGTTVGGSLVHTQKNLPILIVDGKLTHSGAVVFDTNNRPSFEDLTNNVIDVRSDSTIINTATGGKSITLYTNGKVEIKNGNVIYFSVDLTGKITTGTIDWGKVNSKPIVQVTGTSTTNFMSQKATTDELNKKLNIGDYGVGRFLSMETNPTPLDFTRKTGFEAYAGKGTSGEGQPPTHSSGDTAIRVSLGTENNTILYFNQQQNKFYYHMRAFGSNRGGWTEVATTDDVAKLENGLKGRLISDTGKLISTGSAETLLDKVPSGDYNQYMFTNNQYFKFNAPNDYYIQTMGVDDSAIVQFGYPILTQLSAGRNVTNRIIVRNRRPFRDSTNTVVRHDWSDWALTMMTTDINNVISASGETEKVPSTKATRDALNLKADINATEKYLTVNSSNTGGIIATFNNSGNRKTELWQLNTGTVLLKSGNGQNTEANSIYNFVYKSGTNVVATTDDVNLRTTKTTQVIAGNGLTGGGALSANRTIALGTPSETSVTSTNSVTATSHTHALSNEVKESLKLADTSVQDHSLTGTGTDFMKTDGVMLVNTTVNPIADSGLPSTVWKNALVIGNSRSKASALLMDDNTNYAWIWNSSTKKYNKIMYEDTGLRNFGSLGTKSLNDLGNVSDEGIYYNSANSNATTARGYPVQLAGTLFVLQSAGMTQIYIAYNNGQRIFKRNNYGSSSPWSKWVEEVDSTWVVDVLGTAKNKVASQFLVNTVNTDIRKVVSDNDTAIRTLIDTTKTDLTTEIGKKANNTVNIVAGNGLTGGGTISSNRTITLGTPTEVSTASTNSVTSTGHTHALSSAVKASLAKADNARPMDDAEFNSALLVNNQEITTGDLWNANRLNGREFITVFHANGNLDFRVRPNSGSGRKLTDIDRTWVLPNKSGTVALTSDIPAGMKLGPVLTASGYADNRDYGGSVEALMMALRNIPNNGVVVGGSTNTIRSSGYNFQITVSYRVLS